MDELTASLAGSFSVSVTPNSTAAPHPRFSQYKSKTDFASQSERRRRYLELQKQCVDFSHLHLGCRIVFQNIAESVSAVAGV